MKQAERDLRKQEDGAEMHLDMLESWILNQQFSKIFKIQVLHHPTPVRFSESTIDTPTSAGYAEKKISVLQLQAKCVKKQFQSIPADQQ